MVTLLKPARRETRRSLENIREKSQREGKGGGSQWGRIFSEQLGGNKEVSRWPSHLVWSWEGRLDYTAGSRTKKQVRKEQTRSEK